MFSASMWAAASRISLPVLWVMTILKPFSQTSPPQAFFRYSADFSRSNAYTGTSL